LHQLCESFRLDDRVRQRVIIGLGKLDELPTDEQKMQLGKRTEERLEGKTQTLFSNAPKSLNVYRVIFTARYSKSNVMIPKATNRICW
jgi:hypothetical protein